MIELRSPRTERFAKVAEMAEIVAGAEENHPDRGFFGGDGGI